MPSDTEDADTLHVAIPVPQPPTPEPKWRQMLRTLCDWVTARFRRDAGAEIAVAAPATLLGPGPHVPHVHRPGDPPDTDEPKVATPRLGTAPDEHAAKPRTTLADLLSPQWNPGHPPSSLGPAPTGPQAHVVHPGDPPTTDEPK